MRLVTIAIALSFVVVLTGCGSTIEDNANSWTKEDNEAFENACRDIRISAGLTGNYSACETLSTMFRNALTNRFEKWEDFDKDCYKDRTLRNLEDFYELPRSSVPDPGKDGENVEEFAQFLVDFIFASGSSECVES